MKPGAKERMQSTISAAGGDVAAHHAERLGQRAFDDVDAVHRAVARGHAGAARTVKPHAMDFVEIGQRAVFLGQIADRRWWARNRRPWNRRIRRRSAWARPDWLPSATLPDAARSLWRKTHFSAPPWRMPSIIEAWLSSSEKTIRPGRILAERRQRRVVGDEAGGEQQRRFLAVQIGQLGFQLDMIMRGAGDVARAARTGAGRVDRLMHGRQHLGMLAHAEIIVAAPDGDRPRLARRRRDEVGLGIIAAAGARCRRTRDNGLRA